MLMLGPLVVGTLVAVYFLAVGPAALRIMSGTLVGAWVLGISVNFASGTDFRSFERLYAEAYPFVALALLPSLCVVARLVSARMFRRKPWKAWWGEAL